MPRPLSAVLLAGLVVAAAVLAPPPARAQEFSAVISPPRFEDRAEAGDTYRNVLEIANTSTRSARFTVQTADWELDENGGAVFSQVLADGSCRPWVGIEASEITLRGNGKRRFRFEVAVPPGTPAGECRFALMFEGEPQLSQGPDQIPVSGRIGVIVYLAIGDAEPRLELLQTITLESQGLRLPALRVRNAGNMHGRLEGYLAGVDAAGQRIVLIPDNSPILVGTTRDIPLYPQAETPGEAAPAIHFPIRIKGRLDSDRQRLDIDTSAGR